MPHSQEEQITPLVNLYAEFLLNIRQVTIYASLVSDFSKETEFLLSSDRKSICVAQEGKTSRITFPSGITGTAKLGFPSVNANFVSCRFQITEDDKPSQGPELESSSYPEWVARDFR